MGKIERLLKRNNLKTEKKAQPTYIEDEMGNKYEERIVDGTKKLVLVESYDGIMNL